MQTITREESSRYEFGRDMDPLITVQPGEQFTVETGDPFKDTLFDHGMGEFTAADVPTLNSPPPGFDVNPVSGPVSIDGAEQGRSWVRDCWWIAFLRFSVSMMVLTIHQYFGQQRFTGLGCTR